MNDELRPSEPAVGRTYREPGGFGDNRRVGANAGGNQGTCAGTAKLFVGHGGDDHFAGKSALRGMPSGRAHRGDAALHVGGAAAEELPVANDRIPRFVRHSGDADRIEMAVEH